MQDMTGVKNQEGIGYMCDKAAYNWDTRRIKQLASWSRALDDIDKECDFADIGVDAGH